MKTLLKVVGVILVCLVLLLAVARIAGFEPNGPRPGLWLKGDLATTPVAGWSFTDNIQNVKNVARDPHVRIKIGDRLYDRTLALVGDPAEQEAVQEARSEKYPQLKLPPGGTIVSFHVLDR